MWYSAVQQGTITIGDLWVKGKLEKGVGKSRGLVQAEGYVRVRDRKPVSFLACVPTSETDSTVVQRSVKMN